ncbi:phospholipase D-like domain-containing protein [Aeromonas salmonicida]|uniref:phospholipase D-like domain-containing protein n=1 Tax=Aeromonas salmonicida TaxID=645 RepID=UPI000F7B9C59|nr:phospholipase D-like domain-containing protein [Aeromonas salmonicida]RSM21860.1 hypothetical protein C5B77_23245 [Aeromonas salmonicida]
MNPRLFCRATTYHKALLLTYSFDPIFFEQVVLPDLWAGRSSDILVLGDKGEIETSVQLAAGHLWNLGKQYLLASADVAGAFHPKVFLRLGPKDGIVMVGSGNVTSSGWGGNQELGTAWMVGPNHIDKGWWLHPFLDDVLTWCQGDLERDAIRRIKDVPWLSFTPANTSTANPMLYSRGARSLAAELAQHWAGRRFNEVKILTGSTDESGAFLRWAQETFGITRATIALTPASASFVAEKLNDLPLELRLVAAPADRPLHAKFYWFDGSDGPAAVMGSANCSAAAWLRAPKHSGNVESIVVYDQPDAQDFESALGLLSMPGQAPAEILLPRPRHDRAPAAHHPSFGIKSLQWDNSAQRMVVELVPTPDPAAQVNLRLGECVLPMVQVNGPRALWMCEITERLGAATIFASVIVTIGSDTWTTASRWVDDLASLVHASHAARLLEPFKALDRSTNSSDQRQMLDELQEVAVTLFNDPSSFRDPGFGDVGLKEKYDAPADPVNPDDLIFHLDESLERLPHLSSAQPGSFSLTGILSLLFEAETDEGRTPTAAGDEDIDEGQMPSLPNPTDQKDQAGAATDVAVIEERFRKRLAAQINNFLTQMAAATFAERCTATQMVQAVSFPLAVALRGRRTGWVPEELAERWALEVFSILFHGQRHESVGLLRAVEQRYVHNGQKDTFDYVVGDGTLWLVVVATLGGTSWQGVGTDIDKAVALKEVFAAPQLLASATSDRITGLLGKIRIEDAKAYVADVAPTVNRLLGEIEHTLRPIWMSEIQAQRANEITHKLGDLLWRDGVGWAVCLKETQEQAGVWITTRRNGLEKLVMAGFYVNLSEVCSRHPVLNQLVIQLKCAVVMTMTAGK